MDEIIKILLENSAAGIAVAAILLGVVIPKHFYDREVQRADLATDDNRKMRGTLELVTGALKVVSDAVADLKAELAGVRTELKDSREEVRRLREELLRTGLKVGRYEQ